MTRVEWRGINTQKREVCSVSSRLSGDRRWEKCHLAQGCCEGLVGAVQARSELGTDASCQFGSAETFYGVLGHFTLPLRRDGRRVHKRYPVDYLGAGERRSPSAAATWFATSMAGRFWSGSPVWFAPRTAWWRRIPNERWPPHDRRRLITVSEQRKEVNMQKTTQSKRALNVGLDACGAGAMQCLQRWRSFRFVVVYWRFAFTLRLNLNVNSKETTGVSEHVHVQDYYRSCDGNQKKTEHTHSI